MALSKRTQDIMVVAFADKKAAQETASAIGSALSTKAAHVANIADATLVGVDGTGSNAAPLAGTQTQLNAIDAKINAILAALQAAGLMS